jgi:methylenetetrahydrofolate dehydrogenase (NADP+)/methenyltetrahydrofolate cyclohydrolase
VIEKDKQANPEISGLPHNDTEKMPKKTAQLIDGKNLAEKILLELKGQIAQLNRPPGLAVILIGDDPASKLYVRNKKLACEKVGIVFHSYFCGGTCLPNVTEIEILKAIDFLNNDPTIDGIIVQLPIPQKFNTQKIINRIDPKKDVDGFHPENQKKIITGTAIIIPPLIQAVNAALMATQEELKDKNTIIISKNPIFSEPLKIYLSNQGLKVETVKPDQGLADKTKKADILITVVGQKHLIKKNMVKPDAIIIDVGTNLISENKWTGDVDQKVTEVAGWLTPVPGGIGPLTVAFLLTNTYQLAKKNLYA